MFAVDHANPRERDSMSFPIEDAAEVRRKGHAKEKRPAEGRAFAFVSSAA
jgi:hypothetical protein